MTETAEIVGDNDGLARTEEIIAQNTKVVAEAERSVAAAEVEVTRLESDDPSASGEGKPVVEPNAGVYADVGMEALGGAALKTASTLIEVLEDGGIDKFSGQKIAGSIEGGNAQGIEDFIKGQGGKKASVTSDRPTSAGGSVGRATAAATKDVMGDKLPRSIRTAFRQNVMADVETASGSINGEDKISGARVNQASVATLQGQALQQTLAKTLSMQHAGHAIQHKAGIHAQMGQARMAGMSPDGAAANPKQYQSAQTLNLNTRAPGVPNFKDTNISEDTATG